jgi:hypothetical protein
VLAGLLNLILFSMLQFFVILGIAVFSIGFYVKNNPNSAPYWAGVVRRILEL